MKSENSLKIHFATSEKQNFIFYFEIFCCKEEFAVLYYIQRMDYTPVRVHRLHGATLRVCFGLLASELADKPYIDYRIGRCTMAVSYKKLWKLLIEKDMKKTDLRIKAGISTGALAKLGKNENVNTEILGKICKVLGCGVDDVMEFVPEDKE
jgi:DNA-binding Xre family transcriptional regulator